MKIQLYLSWRNEDELKIGSQSYKKKIKESYKEIYRNSKKDE